MGSRTAGLALVCIVCLACNDAANNEKVGVLMIHVGSDDAYTFDWHTQFMDNLFDFFQPGQMAGGLIEGEDCYTLIHYADEAEAAICKVAEGTPIDVFCREYTDEASHPVQSMEQVDFAQFSQECTADAVPLWFILSAGHATIDPRTKQQIVGPYVKHPQGAGLKIADFVELAGFNTMQRLYHAPGHRDLHKQQTLKWWYGNDAPGLTADAVELTNVKDALLARAGGRELAFRHGWEAYMENRDPWGNPRVIPDSTETAITELIEQEGVDRIVVFHAYPSFANLTQYGHEWVDKDGEGISAIPGKTFKECVLDTSDGVGPDAAGLAEYLAKKPWDKHSAHPFPLIEHLARQVDPGVQVDFAPGYGQFAPFGDAVLELLRYTVKKHKIPESAALKVILAHHGYFGAYQQAQDCDAYNRLVEQLYQGVSARVEQGFSWSGRLELAHGAGEYAEAELPGADEPGPGKPHGDAWGAGELIDIAINGKWVNALGELVDNGTDNFDYVVMIPYYFEGESPDTIYCKRHLLGNHIPDDYKRDEDDADGTPYDAGDLDHENFTVKVFDATGWPSTPKGASAPVYKGSATKPTTVIITGTYLSLGNGGVRSKLTEAAVEAILSTMESQQ